MTSDPCPLQVRRQHMDRCSSFLVDELGVVDRAPSQSENTLRVQSYDVATGEWLRLKENAFRSGLNLTCALHNDGVYIMSRDVGAHLLKYNLFSGAWESGGTFPALGHNTLLCSLYLPHWL